MKKLILGHSHTPAIAKGAYQIGITRKSPVYGAGPATWQNGHVIVYPNGTVVAPGYNSKAWQPGQKIRREDLAATYRELYGGIPEHPTPRRREAIEHTRRKLGL